MGTFGLERPVQGKGNIAVAPVPYQGFRGPARVMLVQAGGRSNSLRCSRLKVHPPQQVLKARVVAEGVDSQDHLSPQLLHRYRSRATAINATSTKHGNQTDKALALRLHRGTTIAVEPHEEQHS